MDESVKKYLQEKYAQDLDRINSAQAFANLGDVFARQKVGSTAGLFNQQRALAEDQSMGEIARQEAAQQKKDAMEMQRELLRQRLEDQAYQKELDRNLRRDMAAQARQNANIQKEKVLTDKQEGQIQNLSKSVSGVQDAFNNIDAIETALGAPLEQFSVKDGELMRGGKQVDLPGVSIPMIGRVSAYSGEARDLSGKVASVFNTVLKDRSGAAVTNSEMERLKNEFGQGKYNTEPEMIKALGQYKIALSKELKNREAGFKPEVVSEYAQRGGRTSKSFNQSQPIRETRSYQGKQWELVGEDRTDPKSWKVVGE